ncbi:MAG: CPBP family intramembrane metalloprotease [Saprospirales bacterium]|nr:MAG: CPBP family intramembrane metalloprotease [Saprospirales bacterium]
MRTEPFTFFKGNYLCLMKIDFTNVRVLGFLTLFGFGIAGLILSWFTREPPLLEFYSGFYSIPVQLLTGYLFGLIWGYAAWGFIELKMMRKVKTNYGGIISRLNLKTRDVWFLSLCAGVGEELFFRAGLQPLLGIWITSIIFVAIHGYLNPRNWRISLYGLLLCFFIAGLGYMTEEIGIISAITAHMIFDVVLLKRLSNMKSDDGNTFNAISENEDTNPL